MVFIIHCFLLDWYFTTLGDPEGRNTWLMQLCSVTMPIQLLLGQIDHVPTVAFFFSSYRRGRVGQSVLNLRISRCALGNSGMTDPPLRSAVHEDSKERSVGLFRGKVIFSLLQDWSRAE
jgi:hypothetical protein